MTKIEVTDSEGIRQKQIDANKQTNGKLITLSKNKRKKVPLCLKILTLFKRLKLINQPNTIWQNLKSAKHHLAKKIKYHQTMFSINIQ